MGDFLKRLDVRVSAIYCIAAALWILLSDAAMTSTASENWASISLIKGIGFVAVTTLALFGILTVEMRKRNRVEQALKRDNAALRQTESARRESEGQLRLYVEHAPAAIAMLDQDMKYLLVSQRWLADYRLNESSVIGRSHYDIFPDLPEQWKEVHQRCLQGAVESNAADPFPRADGTLDWVRWEIRPWRTDSREIGGIFIFSEVITERVEAENAVRRYAQRLEILHEIDTGIINATSIQEVVGTTLKHIRQIIPCQQAATVLFDFPANEVLIFAGDVNVPSAITQGSRYPMPPGLLEDLNANRVHVIDDLQSLPDSYPSYRQVRQEGMRSALRALLSFQGNPIGLLALNADTPGSFTPEYQEIAGEIANQLAIAIQQMNLAEALGHHVQAVEDMQQFLQTTLDAFPANTSVLSPDGTIVNVNLPWKNFAEANNGQGVKHYLGDNYLTVCDAAAGSMSEEAAAAASGIRAVIAGEQDDFYLEYPCNSSSRERWFMLRVTPFAEPAPRRVVVAHVDITEHKQAQKAEHEQRILSEALRDSLAALTASTDVQAVMQQILAYSATVIPGEAGTIILFEGNTGRVASSRGFSPEAEAFFKDVLIPLDTGVFSLAMSNQAFYLAADTRTTPNWTAFSATDWIRSSIGVPIVLHGEAIGLLISDSKTPNQFQQKDVVNLQNFARYAALALQNVQHIDELERRVEERTSELQAAKNRVEVILNNSGDGILLAYDDFTIQQTNMAFNKLFACEPDDYFKQPFSTIFQIESDGLIDSTISSGAVEGKTATIEARLRRRNGTEFDAELSIGFVQKGGFVCSIRNITERKEQERQLRYHASLQENVSDAVIVSDLEFHIQSWNKAAERIYGWKAEEVIGKKVEDTLQTQFETEEARQRFSKEFFEQGFWSGEAVQVRKDGGTLPLLGSITLLKDKQGVAFGVISIIRDITEQKAQERQLRYQASLQETVSEAVIVTDLEFRIQSWNKAAERIYGWIAEEVIGQATTKILQTEYPSSESRASSRQELLEQGWWQGEVIQRHRDGSNHHILGSVTLVKDKSGAPFGIVAVNHDITEQKLAQEALQKSSAEILDLYNNAPCGYHSLDKDGLFVQINDTELRWLGYSRDDVISKLKITDIFAPESVLRFQNNFPLFKERGWINDLEFDVIRKDGSVMHILLNSTAIYDENDQYLKSRSTIFDITELRQAQQTIVESEARYRLLAENVTDVIAKINSDGIRTFVTPSCYSLLGYRPEELIGRLGIEIVHPDDRLATLSVIEQAQSAGKTAYSFSQRVRHKAGHYVWVEVTSSVVRDPATGTPTETIGVIRDITERKQAEEALNQKMEEEREFQRCLKALHDITIELTQIDELDTFYKRAVESGLERLGFERLALFLYDENDGIAQGTYGTDPQGKLSDERHVRLTPDPNGIMLRAFNRSEHFYYDEHVPLYGDLDQIGFGWNAATVLWNGTQSLGWLVADSFVSQTPASKPLLDILGLYGLTIGTLLAQKQVQIALQESEERFRQIAENIDQILFIRSGDDQKMLYINPSYESMWGRSRTNLYENPNSFVEIMHPDDTESVRQQLGSKRYLEEGLADFEYRIIPSKQHIHWVRARTFPIKDDNGVIVRRAGIIEDITQRKQSEEALRQSEEKFRLLLDAAPVATVISDQTGRITLVNVQAETLFGYSRSELVGQMVEILVPDYARGTHVHNRTTYMAEPRVRPMGLGLELFARRKDAAEFPVEIQLSYIETQDGLMVMSFVLDITERKQAAAELENQRSFLRSVIDVSPSMIFVKDYDARFVLANPMVARMYSTTVEALIGRTDADFNPSQKEIDNFLEADRQVIASGEQLFMEEPITNFAGETRWLQTTKVPIVSADGRSKYVLGVATDITERKRAEAALQESEEKYRSLIETMRGGLVIFDLDNKINFINDRFLELLGYSREEVLGTRAVDYVDPTNLPTLEAHLKRRRHLESSSYELVFRHKDGHPIYLLVSGSPLLGKNGEYIGSFAVTTDISAQKQAEDTLREALAKEKELGELKTRFVSMASHEFRTPLATILALTETVSAYRHKMSEDQIADRLNKIKDQVDHLKDIMEDILLLARMQARRVEFNPIELDVDALCRSVLDEFQSRADVNNHIEYTCNTLLRRMTLDKKLMRQIISNLVSNAVKYSPQGTSVAVNLDLEADALVLTVSDHGIGIPEADLKHLFEPFHRAANVSTISGTGLGLVIVKESVELHGGTISVKSQIDVGTTFVIRIPISEVGETDGDENPGHRR
jgi:PAS domain S-box-containing protein